MIIDCDTGVDDAQAIMMALSRPEVDVIAITCVNGNVDIENVCRNTLRVLKVCDALHVSNSKLILNIVLYIVFLITKHVLMCLTLSVIYVKSMISHSVDNF